DQRMAAQTSTATKPGAPLRARHEGTEAGDYLAAAAELLAKNDPALTAFFESFTRYASAEDLVQFTGAELAALVKAVHARTVKRLPEKSQVEIFARSAEDKAFAKRGSVVLAVNDDIPFLYDSSTAEVRAQGGQ